MNGFDVKILLNETCPETSREVLIPQKITFKELEKIICLLFGLTDVGSSDFSLNYDGKTLLERDDYLVEKYMGETLCFNYQNKSHLWFDIILKKTLEYDENFVSLIDYSGSFNPLENANVSLFNTMMIRGDNLERFKPAEVKKDLQKIKIYKNRAFDIRITCQKKDNTIWRDFLIPERITFKDLEDLILVSFDTEHVSFKKDDMIADYYFKRDIPIYTSDNKFKIEFKGKVFSDKNFTQLKDYSGGLNPYDLWYEYYPKAEPDKAQSSLDDF